MVTNGLACACESRALRGLANREQQAGLAQLDCLHCKGMDGVRKHTGRMSTPPPSPAGSGYVAQAADAAGSSAAPASLCSGRPVEVEDIAAAGAREWSKPEAGAVGSWGEPGRATVCPFLPAAEVRRGGRRRLPEQRREIRMGYEGFFVYSVERSMSRKLDKSFRGRASCRNVHV